MRLTVCPTLNLWVRIIIANTPSVAFRNTLVAGFADISLERDPEKHALGRDPRDHARTKS
jgi:hypothetical protein